MNRFHNHFGAAPEAYCRPMLDHAPFGICWIDMAGLMHDVNPALARLLGYPEGKELESYQWRDLFSVPHDFERLQGTWSDSRRFDCAQVIWCRKDKSTVHVSLTGQVLDDCLFDPRFLLFVSDICKHNRLEEELRQSQKLEAIRLLAGAAAHDFNNIIMVMRGNLELLLELITPEDPRHRYVLEIMKAADRGTRLTKELLTFSRPERATGMGSRGSQSSSNRRS